MMLTATYDTFDAVPTGELFRSMYARIDAEIREAEQRGTDAEGAYPTIHMFVSEPEGWVIHSIVEGMRADLNVDDPPLDGDLIPDWLDSEVADALRENALAWCEAHPAAAAYWDERWSKE